MESLKRREFLWASFAGAAAAVAGAGEASPRSRVDPWVLRSSEAPVTGRGELCDARTGEPVGRRVPLRCAARLERSRVTGRPVRIALYRLGPDGWPFAVGDRVATEPAWVRVVGPGESA